MKCDDGVKYGYIFRQRERIAGCKSSQVQVYPEVPAVAALLKLYFCVSADWILVRIRAGIVVGGDVSCTLQQRMSVRDFCSGKMGGTARLLLRP